MWVAIEVLVYGTFFTYVLALVPAAVVSILKRRWIPYVVGFFSFGLGWFYGAVDIAKPRSWWDRKFYDGGPARESRAFDEARRKVALRGGLIAVAALILIGLFAARPTPFLGVDGTSLQNSTGGLFASADSCRAPEGDGETWTCFQYDDAFSGDAAYRTTVGWTGCWEGEGIDRGQARLTDPKISGCVTIFDHIRPLGWILN